ncbi:DUF2798 domain-containing protein [bacterium]|nr:DUF2798 domain-containing protein [bacterium]NUN44950.1 DUF2798 domain-containing protein [bacterium]
MKFNKKHSQVLFVLFMALTLSCIMSLVMTLRTFGVEMWHVNLWLQAWGFSFLVAFPVAYIAVPRIRRLVEMITE